MQATTPGAASTQPKWRSELPPRTDHIYPILYLEDLENCRLMDQLYARRCRQARRSSQELSAIWASLCALEAQALRYLRTAKDDGKLLMCWEGSTVVNLPCEESA